MQVKTIQNLDEWNKVASRLNIPFAQSWQWGDILITEGKNVERLTIEKDGAVVTAAQVVYLSLIFGWHYVFCPKGPVGELNVEVLDIFVEYFKTKKVLFWRIEPAQKIISKNLKNNYDVIPRATLVLDLQKREEDILNAMDAKTRYNIRLAQKKNLKIKNENNLKIFLELMKKTGSRDNFRLHENRHYEVILNSDLSRQLTVYSEQIPVATAIFVGYGDVFTYLFGASDHEYRQLMAPYLLQWEGIKIGQSEGYKFYDFFGVAPKINDSAEYEFDEKHQYGGVSRFKQGFGGRYTETLGTFDFILNKTKYNLYTWLRKLRRII